MRYFSMHQIHQFMLTVAWLLAIFKLKTSNRFLDRRNTIAAFWFSRLKRIYMRIVMQLHGPIWMHCWFFGNAVLELQDTQYDRCKRTFESIAKYCDGDGDDSERRKPKHSKIIHTISMVNLLAQVNILVQRTMIQSIYKLVHFTQWYR